MSARPRILICCVSDPETQRWSEVLRDGAEAIELDTTRRENIDLILIGAAAQAPDWIHEGAGRSEELVGIISLGGQALDTDLVLPAEATEAEVQLACRLMHEIVTLRRQLARRESQARRLLDESRKDHLTGISNRRHWDETLATWPGGLLAILDIDAFKKINDLHGHAAGDRVLARTAVALASAVRNRDLVARLGGDEFGLLLSGVKQESAFAVADRLRKAVSEAAPEGIAFTASLGFVLTAGMPREKWQLSADGALLAAKRAGRNRSCQADGRNFS